MPHGIDTFFDERAGFRRRLSLAMIGVGVGWLAIHFTIVAIVRNHEAELDRIAERWGYEGPDQYVRRIVTQSESGPQAPAVDLAPKYVAPARRGGDKPAPKNPSTRAAPPRRPSADQTGEGDIDRLARARAQLLNVPLVRSENLVIEKLVRPDYPELARARGIEGRVAVLALVDTTGRVHDVESVGASEDRLLERAAELAVMQCRFRPYEVDGRKQAVYAMFRFSFKLD